MDLLVFGATGGTGRALTRMALGRDHAVTAVCRDPFDLGIDHPALTTVRGDVFEPGSFADHVTGKDAMLSCLGVRPSLQAVKDPPPLYSRGTGNVLDAMAAAGVTRFIGLTSSSVDEKNPEPLFWRVGKNVLAKMYDDMRAMEAVVRASTAEWTLVRPSMLTDGGLTLNYRERPDINPEGGWRVSRTDVADFVLREAEHPRHVGAAVALAY